MTHLKLQKLQKGDITQQHSTLTFRRCAGG